jgi:riboflavin biosynthesis pyrimidine reductase
MVSSLQSLNPDACFDLIADPSTLGRAFMIGMFVLRPGSKRFDLDLLRVPDDAAAAIHDDYDWVYGVQGFSGPARVISNSSPFDAYRVALHYGVVDAVLVGSGTACAEGISSATSAGYLWQPQFVCAWSHLQSADKDMLKKINEQRKEWQNIGLLSPRKHPAQLVFTASGRPRNGPDFLQCRVFHDRDQDGRRIEAYILTSALGADEIRSRAKLFGIAGRINDKLVIVPPRPGHPSDDIDIALIPEILFKKLDIRLVNHDGGRRLMEEFIKAGAIDQLHLTLGMRYSVEELIARVHDNDRDGVEKTVSDFQYLFHNGKRDFPHSVPRCLEVVSVLSDEAQDVAYAILKPSSLQG